MRVVITGATGTVGRKLVAALASGHVTVLSRSPAKARTMLEASAFEAWDGVSKLPSSLFEGADAVFHLAGEPVAEGRWNTEKKALIASTRVDSTKALVDAMGQAENRPKAFICASAVGYYGDGGDAVLTETTAVASDFLAGVCAAWEGEARRASSEFGIRTAMLRLGVVLDGEGGALAKMLPVFRAGLGGKLASGNEWMPWVHIDDVVGLFLWAAQHASLEGPVNVVAPEPVRNREFTKLLGAALHRPAFFAVPEFALRAALGEVASVVLASQRAVPAVAEKGGYVFKFRELSAAFADLFAPRA